MKEYRYKINGNLYKVTVGDIEDNNVHVEVNGTAYTVEMEKKTGPKIKPVVRTAATTPAAPPPAAVRLWLAASRVLRLRFWESFWKSRLKKEIP